MPRKSSPAPPAAAMLLALAAAAAAANWQDHAPHPFPVANNAVTTHVKAGTTFVYSFLGIDSTKVFSGIGLGAARLNTVTNVWETLPDVPLANGRIAASAVTLGDSVYVIGGYRVASNGQETTGRGAQIFDTVTDQWVTAPPLLPRRVDDMVTGVWADSLIFCVSGWSQSLNVPDVQFFDPASNSWGTSTPVPDFGTFGAVGGVCGDHIVYIDGVADTAAFAFDLVNRVLVGAINPADPTQITWEDRGPHPGAPVYRGASWNLPGDDTRVLISGGTDNPYNYDGIGYDGNPSEPLGQVWSYHVASGTVVFHENKPVPTMDHRGWPAGGGGRLWIVGGMEAGQTVTDRVSSWLPDAVTANPLTGPAALPEIRAYPTPARHGVRFAAAGGATLEAPRIADVAGRTVRTWPERAPSELEWNLRDEAGSRVAPGVYWITARVDGRTAARSIVVLSP